MKSIGSHDKSPSIPCMESKSGPKEFPGGCAKEQIRRLRWVIRADPSWNPLMIASSVGGETGPDDVQRREAAGY